MPLDISMSIHGPAGWIELEDPGNGYEAHKEAASGYSVSWRKREISSPYVDGTFTNDAVKENIVESVVVYVFGATDYELKTRIAALVDAFSQLSYQMKFRSGDAEETWDCQVAEFSTETTQEFRNATMATVRAQVPRLPYASVVQVVP